MTRAVRDPNARLAGRALTRILEHEQWRVGAPLLAATASALGFGATIEAAKSLLTTPSWQAAMPGALWLLLGIGGIWVTLVLQAHEGDVRQWDRSVADSERMQLEKQIEQVREQYVVEKGELLGFISGFAGPALGHFPNLVSRARAERDTALASATITALNGAAHTCGPHDSGVRAIWFEADKRKLVAQQWAGGACQSKRVFSNYSSNLEGKTAWEAARQGVPILWANLDEESPRGYTPSENSRYKTFITCGVLDGNGDVLGMVNVDAPRPGDLTEVDKKIVGICAQILASAIQLKQKQGSVGVSPIREVERDKESREDGDNDEPGEEGCVA